MGNSTGLGHEAGASRDHRVASLAWRKVTCAEACRCGHAVRHLSSDAGVLLRHPLLWLAGSQGGRCSGGSVVPGSRDGNAIVLTASSNGQHGALPRGRAPGKELVWAGVEFVEYLLSGKRPRTCNESASAGCVNRGLPGSPWAKSRQRGSGMA